MKRKYPIICTDACLRRDLAALAVTGDVGRHSKVVPCRSSVLAEIEALLFAMAILRGSHDYPRRAVLRTDCEAAAFAAAGHEFRRNRGLRAAANKITRELVSEPGWTVEHVHRSVVQEAHVLATRTRLSFNHPVRAIA